MKEKMMRTRVLIMRDNDWWIAQCLEYDIAAQARTFKDVQYELQRVLFGRMCMANQLGIDPFEGIPAAPEKYHRLFENKDETFKVEFKNIKFKPIENICTEIPEPYMLLSEEAHMAAMNI